MQANITITIRDLPNGRVEVKSDPSFETMCNMHQSGHELTAAHGYALAAMNHIRLEAKKPENNIQVGIPLIGR